MRTTAQDLQPSWHAFSHAPDLQGQQVPNISQGLAQKPRVRRPNHIDVKLEEFEILSLEKTREQNSHADRILSAHKLPMKFPVRAEHIQYPPIVKRGASNPLFRTTAMEVGAKVPMQHQLAERYFPLNNNFSQSFANRRVKFTTLNTNPSRSRIHSSFDS